MQDFFSMRHELAAAQDEAQKAATEARSKALLANAPHLGDTNKIIAMYSDIRMPMAPFPRLFFTHM